MTDIIDQFQFTNFWDSYCLENRDIILRQFALVGACNFNIPLSVLNKLSQCCKYLFVIVQRRINICKRIYNKWIDRFGRALYEKSIRHPFEYTGDITKIIPIYDTGINNHGLKVFDIIGGLFTADYLNNNRLALTNINFIVRDQIPFVLVLLIKDTPIIVVEVSDFIELGQLTPEMLEKYDDNPALCPGQYFVSLNLPTRFNPITLEYPFISMVDISLCIAREWLVSDHSGSSCLFDVDLVIDNFTHAIANFKTVDNSAYNWSLYGMTFNGEVNKHARTTSLIRRLDDPELTI